MSVSAIGLTVFALVFGSALFAVFVHNALPKHHLSARIYDPPVIGAIHDLFSWLRHFFADSAYAGDKHLNTLAKFGNWTIEIVRRIGNAVGFAVLPRRWVVERTLAWLNRNRRLAKDFDATIASAEARLDLASVGDWRRPMRNEINGRGRPHDNSSAHPDGSV